MSKRQHVACCISMMYHTVVDARQVTHVLKNRKGETAAINFTSYSDGVVQKTEFIHMRMFVFRIIDTNEHGVYYFATIRSTV